MNSNCNCELSVLKKPCPRGVFDCRRCLSKMKNTGRVWKVTTASNITVKIDGNTQIEFLPFSEKLYWDAQLVTGYLSSDVDSSQVKCTSSIWARRQGIVTEFSSVVYSLNEADYGMGVSLYFEGTWRLSIVVNRFYGGGTIGGFPEGGFTLISRGHYTSEDGGCFIFDPASFSVSEIVNRVALVSTSADEFDNDRITSEFPESILFQHVDAGNFDPNPSFPAT